MCTCTMDQISAIGTAGVFPPEFVDMFLICGCHAHDYRFVHVYYIGSAENLLSLSITKKCLV